MSGAMSTVGDFFNQMGQMWNKPESPKLATPSALSASPTQADASASASKQTLDQEKVAASTSTTLNGGQGLLDEPTTTSSSLMGK